MLCFVAHMQDQSLSEFLNRGGGGMKLEGHRALGGGNERRGEESCSWDVKNN